MHDILAITATENFYRVLDSQGTGARTAEKLVVLGYSENGDSGRLKYDVPNIPNEDTYYVAPWDGKSSNPRKVEYAYKPINGWIATDVINSGLPRMQQVWKKQELPHFWSLQYLTKVCLANGWVVKKAGKVSPDMDKFRNPDNLTEEQYQYAIREWHRRIFGAWIWIGGVLTYLTGAHYYYLTAFRLDNGYPQYRDRDRRWFYAWQVCLEDRKCLGIVYLKHRRDGATYRCGCIGLETATRGHATGTNFGIMSKDDESAREAFKTKVVAPFQRMPFYFSPMVKDKTDVEKMLEFKAPPRSASERYMSDETGLESTIEYKSKGKKGKAGFDSYKLYTLLMDEVGKLDGVSVLDAVRLVTPTMDLDGKWGKILATSTNEEIEGENKDDFETFFYQSDPALRFETGTGATYTKLLHYFTPAYDGLNRAWIGRFGESIVHKPTDEQLEYLMSLDEDTVERYKDDWLRGGAYEFLLTERLAQVDLIGYKRQYPFNPKESFAATNPKSDFNMSMLSRCREKLNEQRTGTKTLFQELTIRGRLEYVGGVVKGDVYFEPDENGPFLINRQYLPIEVKDGHHIVHQGKSALQWGGELAARLRIHANRVLRDPPRQGNNERYGHIRPDRETTWIVIGMDPQKIDKDNQRAKRVSKASSHGFFPYDPQVDGTWDGEMEKNLGFAEDWDSHSWVFHYLHHPKFSRDHHQDMLKACIFWNAMILYERQVNAFDNFMVEMGATSFMVTDRPWAKDKTKGVRGFHSDENYILKYMTRLGAWIDKHCYPKRCPFPELIDQWIAVDVARMELYDAVVSSGAAVLAAQPGELRKDEKTGNLHGATRRQTLADTVRRYR